MSDQQIGDGIFGDGFYEGDKELGNFTPTPRDGSLVVALDAVTERWCCFSQSAQSDCKCYAHNFRSDVLLEQANSARPR